MNRTRTLDFPHYIPKGWQEFTKARHFKDSPLHVSVLIARRKLNRFDIIADDVAGIVFEAFASGKVNYEPTNPGRAIKYAAELIKFAILDDEGATKKRGTLVPGKEFDDLPAAVLEPIDGIRVIELGCESERLLDAVRNFDTEKYATEHRISRRRAQQILASQIQRAGDIGDLFGGV